MTVPRETPGAQPDSKWDEACRRDEVLRSVLSTAKTDNGPHFGTGVITEAAQILGVSRATMYRLLARFKDERRVSSLLPTSPGRRHGMRFVDPAVEAIIATQIRDFYLKPERPSQAALVRQIAAQCRAQGMTHPASKTVRRRLAALDQKSAALKRGDERLVEKLSPRPGRALAEQPLDFVQIDHTLTDIVVVEEATRQFIGRPWLTLGIDVCTRMVTGFALSFDAPSLTSVSLCLLHSVFDKSAWLQSLDIDLAWPVAGLPRRLGLDNAAEFTSPMFVKACREFGIEVEHRPPGAKHFGGHIERLIGTQMGAIQILPGTTHGSIKDKQGYDPQARAVLTLKELEAWLALEIAGVYHQRIHSGLSRAPIALWRDHDDHLDLDLHLPTDRLGFWVAFLPEEERTLQRDGIHLFNICYWSDVLRADVGRIKGQLRVKYDPRNISRIFVERPNGNWIEARYRDLKYPAISRWEYERAMRHIRATHRGEVSEDTIFSTVLRQRELVAKSVSTTAAARRAHAREPMASGPQAHIQPLLTGIDLRARKRTDDV